MDGSGKHDFRAAVGRTWPVMFAYLFLSIAFGLSLKQVGFGLGWSVLLSTVVYAGSLQFALIGFLAAGTAVGTAAILSLFLNARHIFYGISFIARFKAGGKARPYMIFSLTDETYSVLLADTWPADVNGGRADFFTSLLNHLSWICGSVIGSLAGAMIPFDFSGVEFSMTALFFVIFLKQWQKTSQHFPAICGLLSALVFLFILGSDNFLLPSLIVTVLIVLLFQALPEALKIHKEAGGPTDVDLN